MNEQPYLFEGFSSQQLAQFEALQTEMHFATGELIIRDGDVSTELYILKSGQVEILKKEGEQGVQHALATITAGHPFGELALLEDGAPRSASVRALTPVVADKVKITDIQALPANIVAQLRLNLGRILGSRLRHTNEVTLKSLESELKQARVRVGMSALLISVMVVISLYTITLKSMDHLLKLVPSSTFVTLPITVIFMGAILIAMKKSGNPMKSYGLTLKNWQRAVIESVVYTTVLLGIIVIAKAIVIATMPKFHNLPLFIITQHAQLEQTTRHGIETAVGNLGQLAGFVLYIMIGIPIQEFVVRGGLQSSLQEFLVGPYKFFWAILASNLLFSMAHVHMSLSFALFVFPVGLFFGWLYARQGTLIGPCLSHMLLSVVSMLVIGIREFVT
jgi:CRP-like cAMP-binding protein